MAFHGSHNSNLTPTGLANKLIGEIEFLVNNLQDPDLQKIIRKQCDVILQNRAAIADTTNLLPLETALFLIQAMDHKNNQREINALYNEFSKRINDLKEELVKLRSEIETLNNTE